jgi:hypothetical protein
VLCGLFVKRCGSVFALTAALVASAQTATPQSPGGEGEPRQDVPREFAVGPVWGLTVGQVQLVSASLGVVLGTVPKAGTFKCGNAYWLDGFLLQLDAGLGGGKVSMGLATSSPPYGVAIKASGLRTWSNAWGASPGNSYLGVELELVAELSLSLGYMRRVGGSEGPANLFTWGLGYGL